jgi:hypothetical protein
MKFTFAPESKPLEGYTIKRAIYRGGFGEVYYALSDAGREVALKLLQNNTEIELRGVQQCLNLSHPNLVTIFDIREDGDGDHWIVMEYVAGETLDKAVRRFPNGMPMEEIRRWLPGIADGVAFLHEHGLVHRDLKPANIFSDNGCVKIGDVGLSKFITPSRRSAQTQSVGTVYYMAPEVAKGRYGKEVDVYALGIILYEMLTGSVPFEGDSTGEILMKHLTEKPDLNRLPPRLRSVIGRALEKDPNQRFSNVSDFAKSFEDAVLGRNATVEAEKAFEAFPKESTQRCGPAGFCGPKNRARNTRAQYAGYAPQAQWEKPWSSDSRNAPGRLFGSTLKWVVLAIVFGWLHLGMLATAAAIVAAVFGVRFAVNALTWSAVGVAGAVRGVFGDVRDAAGSVKDAAFAVPYAAAGAVKAVAARKTTPAPILTPAMTRWTQWSGAAAVSAFVGSLLTMALAILWPKFGPAAGAFMPSAMSQFVVFGAAAILSAWAITAVTKFWEGSTERLIPRMSLGAIGLGVGAAIWNLESFVQGGMTEGSLFLAMPTDAIRGLHDSSFRTWNPHLLACMAYFGGLLFLRNWRRQTAVGRKSRLRLSSMAFSSAVAGVLSAIMESPPELMMTMAAVTSATVQVASAWQQPTPRVAS